jgi:hypothetical protein
MSARIERRDGFLLEPNYYRLAYQLTAQRANALLTPQAGAADPPAVVAIEKQAEALVDARRLSEYVERALTHLDDVYATSALPWRRLPRTQERRLYRFLLSTVRPSVEIIVAGLELLSGDEAAADARIDALMRRRGGTIAEWHGVLRGSRVIVTRWSFRPYYNLACFEATRHGDKGRRQLRDRLLDQTGRPPGPPPDREVPDVGLWALHQAFRLANDHHRREIVRWALADPSLAPIRDGDRTKLEFAALVERYGAASTDEPAPGYSIEDRPPPEPGPNADPRAVALRELVAERSGYDVHHEAVVTSARQAQQLRVDTLLVTRSEGRPDLLVELHLSPPATRAMESLADQALGALARYEAMTGRRAAAWVVVVLPSGSDGAPLEQRLQTALAGRGQGTVLGADQLPALRRIPAPVA